MTPDEFEQIKKDHGIHNHIVRAVADMSSANRLKVDPIRAIHMARWCERDQKDGRLHGGMVVDLRALLMRHL